MAMRWERAKVGPDVGFLRVGFEAWVGAVLPDWGLLGRSTGVGSVALGTPWYQFVWRRLGPFESCWFEWLAREPRAAREMRVSVIFGNSMMAGTRCSISEE